MLQRIVKKATKYTKCESCGHYTTRGDYYIRDDEGNPKFCSYCHPLDYWSIIKTVKFTYNYYYDNWNVMFPCNLNGYEDLRSMIHVLAWEIEAVLRLALLQEGVAYYNVTRKKFIVMLYENHLKLSKICKTLDDDAHVRQIANDARQLSAFIDSTLESFYDD